MSLADNFKQIMDVFKEKRSEQTAIRKINKENDKNKEEEERLNSAIQELMNIYYNVKKQAELTNININYFKIEPRQIAPNRVGTLDDPRVFLEYAKNYKEFSNRFDIEKLSDENGYEQYKITEKKFNL